MEEAELERYRRQAELRGMSLSEWVRRALARVAEEEARTSPEVRVEALERALTCNHPTGEMDELLADIERGRDLR